jgi:hypothetical protein
LRKNGKHTVKLFGSVISEVWKIIKIVDNEIKNLNA